MWVVTLNKSCIMREASIYKVLAHLRYLNQSDTVLLGYICDNRAITQVPPVL